MTQQSLIKVLTQLGIPRNTYDFDVKTPDIDLMGQIDGKWSLYFTEKGNVSITKQFSSEEEMYDYYLADAYKQQEQRQKTQNMTDADVNDVFAELEKSREDQKKSDETQKEQGNWRDRLIPWHFADTRFDEVIQWSKRQIEHSEKAVQLDLRREKLAQNTEFLRYLSKDALESAIVGFLAETHSQNVYQDLNLSAYAATQLCGTFIYVPEGAKYQINWLADGPLEAVRTPVDAQALPSYFQQAMYCAFICRNIKTLDQLAQLPLEPLEGSTYSPTPPHLHLMLTAFQKFWLGDIQEADNLSMDAIQSIQKEVDNFKVAEQSLTWREEYHLNVTIYNLELFRLAISSNVDSDKFNKKLTEAIYAFRKCMKEHENLADDWNYYFSLGALAWSSLAFDRGFAVDVISDYTPGFLYTGKFADQKLKILISSS
jgi:hypothetical protein